jgi:uncharacterized protein YndB with AHSA1/START domain
MLDHIGFNVSDFERSKAFLCSALQPLAIGISAQGEGWAMLGRGARGQFWFGGFGAPPGPIHIAFAADNREQVRAFHAAALAAGGQDNGGPGLRPQYHADYYGAFVIGPGGHNVEAVCHSPETPASLAAREINTGRLFDAPPERVYRAFADPAQLALWWGPKGFSNRFEQFDLRPGGRWRFTMTAPDGTEFANEWLFVEVAPAQRVLMYHLLPMHAFEMALDFAAEGGGTRLGWRMRFDSVAEAERVRPFVQPANEENLDRLATRLAART